MCDARVFFSFRFYLFLVLQVFLSGMMNDMARLIIVITQISAYSINVFSDDVHHRPKRVPTIWIEPESFSGTPDSDLGPRLIILL